MKIKFVAGPNVRSKTGCRNCKQKRRKCDETVPLCIYCTRRGLECSYEIPPSTNRFRVQKIKQESPKRKQPFNFQQVSFNESEITLPSEDQCTSSKNLVTRKPIFDDTEFPSMEYVLKSPTSFASLFLNDKGLVYYDYFQVHISKELAISFDNMNYFKKLFLPLANTEETFTYMLAAWGALFLKNYKYDEEVNWYITKGQQKFNQLFGLKINEFDTYFQLCYALMKYQMVTCSGDVKVWKVYFNDAIRLIKEYGGLMKLAADFQFSNDIRFIISMIQYSEIMSSSSLLDGTQISIEEYQLVFNAQEFKYNELNYGIDTVQGIHQDVLLLLGKIMNCKCILDALALTKDSDPYNNHEYYHTIDKYATELKIDIDNIEPNYQLWNTISNEHQKDIHMKAYELYKNVCELYRLLYICQIAPTNFQIRLLIKESFTLIDELINTKMTVILCLPLTVCGVCAISEAEKLFIKDRAAIVTKLSPVKNMDKAWVVIQRAWELNEGGTVVVDWAMICKEFGWDLNMS